MNEGERERERAESPVIFNHPPLPMLRMKRSMAEKPQWVQTEPIQAVAADGGGGGGNRGGRGYKHLHINFSNTTQ